MLIYLVRHGRTDLNDLNVIQGHLDSPLNATGHRQVRQLGEKLSDQGVKFDVVYCSDLKRARETAQVILNQQDQHPSQLSAQIILDERLRARNYGSLQGQVWRDALWEVLDSRGDVEAGEALSSRLSDWLHHIIEIHTPPSSPIRSRQGSPPVSSSAQVSQIVTSKGRDRSLENVSEPPIVEKTVEMGHLLVENEDRMGPLPVLSGGVDVDVSRERGLHSPGTHGLTQQMSVSPKQPQLRVYIPTKQEGEPKLTREGSMKVMTTGNRDQAESNEQDSRRSGSGDLYVVTGASANDFPDDDDMSRSRAGPDSGDDEVDDDGEPVILVVTHQECLHALLTDLKPLAAEPTNLPNQVNLNLEDDSDLIPVDLIGLGMAQTNLPENGPGDQCESVQEALPPDQYSRSGNVGEQEQDMWIGNGQAVLLRVNYAPW